MADPDDELRDAPDPWAEADRAWAAPPDAWTEADRRWAEGSAPPEDALPTDPAAEDAPAAAPRGLGRSYADGMSAAGPYLGLGAQIAATMLGSVGLGVLVDRWAGTGPWGVLGGAVFGLVAMVALVVRLSVEANAREARRKGRSV